MITFLFLDRIDKSLGYIFLKRTAKNVYIDKLDDIENKYNSTYHRIIKMKPVDVKCGNYIEQC